MAYVPNNTSVYLAAFAGALAGLGGSGKFPTDSNSADYSFYAQSADAYAQEVDTNWGSGSPTNFEIDALRNTSEAVWEDRATLIGNRAYAPANYSGIANGVIALVQEGNAQVVAEGVDPNATGGGGGLSFPLAAPAGTKTTPQYSFTGDTQSGIYRKSAGLLGITSAGSDVLYLGSAIVSNLQAANVQISSQFFQLPVGTSSETAAIYIKNNYNQGNGTVGLYIEIPTTQLDTYGSAIKVMHMGGGDGIYIAQLTGAKAGGAGIECATFVDASKGFIGTKQTSIGATCNQTLFNALWGENDISNYGIYYIDGSPAHAITIKNHTSTFAYPQIRITTNDLSRDLFGLFPDAHVALSAVLATAGTTLVDSPLIRFVGTYWNGAASVDRSAYFIHHMLSTGPTSDFRFYIGPTGAEQLCVLYTPNETTDVSTGLSAGAGGILDLQVGQIINVGIISNFTQAIKMESNGGAIMLQLNPNGVIDFHTAYTTTVAPAAGGANALPATPKGYMTIAVGGTNQQIAYY